MNKSKILTLLLATSLGAGTFATVVPAQKTNAQSVSKTLYAKSDKSANDNKEQDNNTVDNINENTSSIDTSEFNSQENYTGDSNDGKEVAQKTDVAESRAKVSENFYNFNIPGAQKYTYGTSGKGRPLYYYKIGTGKKVLFMNFGIHGYEDAWARDGEELTKLAKNLGERIAKDNSANGLNGWSVVIVPSANPDGVIDGWSNNGPGRNQVSQKIDLNRSFPTFFKAQYNDRNYTGSTPLAAPEAKALANLVDQFSNSSSHMALVDVHGWLNQTIGDPSLGKAFDNNFGFSNKLMSQSASGYLISYAHSRGALASLLELPMPKNSADIQNRGYANKLYNSVNSIIKNGDGFEVMNADGEVYNTNSLNIRITTSTNSNIIGSYSKGSKIKILGKVGDWYQVKSNVGYGYIHKDYVKIVGNNNNDDNTKPDDTTITQKGKVVNISTKLNIRSGAGTSYGIVGSLGPNANVDIISKVGNWYKISNNGIVGYVSGDYIKVNDSSNDNNNNNNNNNKPDDTTITQKGKVINISTKLNIRSGAGTSYGIVGSLGPNANVDIISKVGNWYKISNNGIVGYVSGDYIKVNDSSNDNNNNNNNKPDDSTSTQKGKVVNISTKLNIRSGAGTNYGIVGSLGPNTTVDIISKEGSWYKISSNGIVGYVSGDYIRVETNDNNSNNGVTEKYGKVVNISTKLNIRKSASTSSSIVGTLSNNAKVTILEKTNGWYKISYNGTVGYVSASYLMEI